MRKRYGAKAFDMIAAADTPHRAGKISKPVDRKEGGLVEWRYEKRTREVRLMMLDAIQVARAVGFERIGDIILDRRKSALRPEPARGNGGRP